MADLSLRGASAEALEAKSHQLVMASGTASERDDGDGLVHVSGGSPHKVCSRTDVIEATVICSCRRLVVRIAVPVRCDGEQSFPSSLCASSKVELPRQPPPVVLHWSDELVAEIHGKCQRNTDCPGAESDSVGARSTGRSISIILVRNRQFKASWLRLKQV